MPNVRMPDGVVVRFPDDMPDEQIRGLIASKFPDTAKPAADAPESDVRPQDLFGRQMIGQGLMVGLGDEAEAVARAAYDANAKATRAGGTKDFSAAYDKYLANARDINKRFEEKHPIAATAAQLAGGLLPAVASGGATAPESIGMAALRGAGAGAGYGAAYGFGTGEGTGDRVGQALTGAAVGGAVGGAIPLGAAAVGEVGRPVANMIRGMTNPDSEASRIIAKTMGKGTPALDDASILRAQLEGQPITNMERGGEQTRALVRSVANQSPEARQVLSDTVDSRFESQGDRVHNFIRKLVGQNNATATRDQLIEQARIANKPAYNRAYAEGDKPLWSPELERLTGSPDVLGAIHYAAKTSKSRAVSEGYGGMNVGAEVTPDGRLKFSNKNGPLTYPNLQFWDYAKRVLSDRASEANRAGKMELADRIGKQASALRNELDRLVPSYRSAREGAASFFGAQDALEAGQKFISQSVKLSDAAKAKNAMSLPEQRLFAEGFADSLINRVAQTGDRRSVVNRIFGSQDARARIHIALGSKRYNEMEAFLRAEAAMDLVRPALQGNSTTVRQLLESVGAGVGTNLAFGGTDNWKSPSGIVSGLLYFAGRRGKMHLDQRLLKQVAEKLVSSDPNAYTDGIQMIARSPRLLAAFRTLGTIAGPAAAQASVGE